MSPSPSTPSATPSRSPVRTEARRRGLAAVASLAGVGAAVSAFMLAPTAAGPAVSAPAISRAAVATRVAPTQVAPATRSSVAPRRVASGRAPTSRAAAVPRRTSVGRSASHRALRTGPVTGRAGSVTRTTSAPMVMPSSDACVGLNAAVDAFMQHFYAAHLETSPGQQVLDALSLDQYAATHMVLVEHMVEPLIGGGSAALGVFLQHLYAAHLETSPGQQVADALAIDQYALTHTVMIADMVAPLLGTDVSSC